MESQLGTWCWRDVDYNHHSSFGQTAIVPATGVVPTEWQLLACASNPVFGHTYNYQPMKLQHPKHIDQSGYVLLDGFFGVSAELCFEAAGAWLVPPQVLRQQSFWSRWSSWFWLCHVTGAGSVPLTQPWLCFDVAGAAVPCVASEVANSVALE